VISDRATDTNESEGKEMKVWLVTSGSYSDYCIEAAFSTRAKANAWVAQRTELNGRPRFQVEEPFEVDGRSAERGVWRAWMEADGGDSVHTRWKAAGEYGATTEDVHGSHDGVRTYWSCGALTESEAIDKVRSARDRELLEEASFPGRGELKWEIAKET
jgi:hypothetical protein